MPRRHFIGRAYARCASIPVYHGKPVCLHGKGHQSHIGDKGQEINEKVIEDFIERYGRDDFSKIEVYFDSDFEIPYPLGLKHRD